ncbi:MAG: glycosyltransferase [Candidatus Nanohaloarchaea archaeon]|nr:glycosyltransferase [Candidatus Nanohaloarchaea archaeon]
MVVAFIAWGLIGTSVFLAVFYLSLFSRNSQAAEETPELRSTPSVAVLMPAYNEEGVVERAVENALSLDYPDYEVIFVDDGSTDDTLEKAKQYTDDDRLRIIEHGENQGKAAALNTALAATDAEYTVVQDADSVIDQGTLEAALARFEADSDVGAVIASIRPLATDNFLRRLQSIEYRITNFYRSLMAHIDIIDCTPGAFSMYRTADLKQLDGFDVGNLTEDLEIAWRLRRLGRRIDMVFHRSSNTEYPPTPRSLYRQRVTWARGSLRNAWKHRDMFFNSEHGWFGVFQLPVRLIAPMLAVVSLSLVAVGIAKQLYSVLLQLTSVGLVLPTLQGFELGQALLGMQWKVYIPLLLSLVVTAYLLRSAYRKAGDSIQYPGALAAFYFGYYILYGFFWSAAIIKELLHTAKAWTPSTRPFSGQPSSPAS